MAKKGHQRSGRNPLLDAIDTERMAKHMGGNGFGDLGFVGHLFDDPLKGSGGHAGAVVFSKLIFNKPADSIGHGQDPALAFFAVGPAFAVNHKPALLPEDIFFFEAGQLAHP